MTPETRVRLHLALMDAAAVGLLLLAGLGLLCVSYHVARWFW